MTRFSALIHFGCAGALATGTLAPTVITGQEADAIKVVPAPAFFESMSPVEVTFTANIGKLRGDKGTDPPWRVATLSYVGPDGNPVTIPMKVRTRGIWRLKMCDFPPLRLNFSGETSKGTIFHKLDKPKLVSYCQDTDAFEQYILQEFQLYRIYHLLAPESHKARLLKLTYADSANGKIRAKRYGFIIEEPKALAARLGGRMLEQKGALPGDLEPYHDALVGVFQYMIGNTDFSERALHNIELFATSDATILAIPYDFDFAGAVNARYATADPKLGIPDVRMRLMRGYCADADSYAKVFALFNEKKADIYALYADSIGNLMDRGTAKETLKYFDDFYRTINDRRSANREIIGACTRHP